MILLFFLIHWSPTLLLSVPFLITSYFTTFYYKDVSSFLQMRINSFSEVISYSSSSSVRAHLIKQRMVLLRQFDLYHLQLLVNYVWFSVCHPLDLLSQWSLWQNFVNEYNNINPNNSLSKHVWKQLLTH